MIDFTNSIITNKTFNGANGNKLSIIYNNEKYMLKFPPHTNLNKNMSYANSTICEYNGSNIFKIIGIPVQDTLLGYYNYNGKNKIVVACKDFTNKFEVIQDFASLKNAIIDSKGYGYGTDLDSILETIDYQNIIEPQILKNRFWDMFIVDALIGNLDRHNGNWGFLYNLETEQIKIAPVYDCGSCLYPQADINVMNKVLNSENEIDVRIYEFPVSVIRYGKNKINYFDFIYNGFNKDCTAALLRIFPKIDINKINKLIDDIECLQDIEKEFYKVIIQKRKEKILEVSFNKFKNIPFNFHSNYSS